MSFRLIHSCLDSNKYDFISSLPIDDNDDNAITVIIGKNGTGKSRLLSAITRCFQAFDNKDYRVQGERSPLNIRRRYIESFNLEFSSEGALFEIAFDSGSLFFNENSSVYDNLPKKVIATSNSPFDKFPIQPIDRKNIFLSKEYGYKYLGTRIKSYFE